MEDQNISIDQLEDKLIDHPPNGNKFGGVGSEKSFQTQLKERANQIGHETWADSSSEDTGPEADLSSHEFLFTKPKLDFTAHDVGSLYSELCQWFTTCDFKVLDLDNLPSKPPFDVHQPLQSIELYEQSSELQSLTYYCLGSYSSSFSDELQLSQIKQNCSGISANESISTVIGLLKDAVEDCIKLCNLESAERWSSIFDANYFQLMTILYFCLSTALDSNAKPDLVLRALRQHKLSATILRLCESWGAQHNSRVRIRYSLMLLWKLLLFEFGGSDCIKKADAYLVQKYSIKNRNRASATNDLVCSKLDYFTYKEDIYDKFPMSKHPDATSSTSSYSSFKENKPDSEESLTQHHEAFMASNDFSGSLSNSMNNPRTNKVHSLYRTLPAQAVHLATPIPSPPSTPSEFMSGGEKVRKSYHVNQGMPFIYPYNSAQVVPDAIMEAENLLQQSVYESYSMKRFSKERELFMKQERGATEFRNFGILETEIEEEISQMKDVQIEDSLNRVESFYQETLPHLRGFINVLVGVVKTSKIQYNLREIEAELDPEFSFSKKYGEKGMRDSIHEIIFKQLETIRAKEITLKAVSNILVLLLKWFKLSHILKQKYLCSLLFDANFFNILVDFLADSFNNSCLQNSAKENKNIQVYDVLSAQNRLMNPKIELQESSFFKFCQKSADTLCEGMRLINKEPLTRTSFATNGGQPKAIGVGAYNSDFCTILANLLNVTNKVLIKNISQRVLVFNETKSTELLKLILLNYVNDELRMPILKIFKKIIPCQGRKWRSVNMDVISLIYLHLKLSLRDNWLSGKDLESDYNTSYEQEVSLRSLLQFYHMRKYPGCMVQLGYDISATPAIIPPQ